MLCNADQIYRFGSLIRRRRIRRRRRLLARHTRMCYITSITTHTVYAVLCCFHRQTGRPARPPATCAPHEREHAETHMPCHAHTNIYYIHTYTHTLRTRETRMPCHAHGMQISASPHPPPPQAPPAPPPSPPLPRPPFRLVVTYRSSIPKALMPPLSLIHI